ncbi:nudix hydrolase 19, chloroplastic [Cinnamomum micranthum f. kanehirae]|uniref:NAD(+) diphosphatase n=1 Tax=Cinnamomum micranthum f. kanehirae TaxID=337451 RepID=A0A3S3NQN2_9MAGN|nr:nudix hydrolase 19, chloroplastic [Cinnamomum micranthum f. kanehirae]
MLISPSSRSPSFLLLFSSQTLTLANRKSFFHHTSPSTMPINMQTHAFAGNPFKTKTKDPDQNNPISPISAVQSLKNLILGNTHEGSPPNFKVLPLRRGRPMASSSASIADSAPNWHLGWISIDDCKDLLSKSGQELVENLLVFLGSSSDSEEDKGGIVYWAIDISGAARDSGIEVGGRRFCFVELRTLMVATNWGDASAMGDLAIAGHAKALLEWHTTSRFCGHCGSVTVAIDAGRRKQCMNEICKKRIYPRVDPVAIMLVIDKTNDRVLLSRPSRFIPRMWTCLSGFIEPGESLEEAVRRETLEETGIEVGEVIYHSSQPWPVGLSSMPCQLMVGFFAYAKSFEIRVDKKELEEAQWYSREDVKKALTFTEYEKAQKTAAIKVEQMCKGVEREQSFASDFNLESGELAPMFIPGPFAIAHHLISTWVHQITPDGIESPLKQSASSSNL